MRGIGSGLMRGHRVSTGIGSDRVILHQQLTSFLFDPVVTVPGTDPVPSSVFIRHKFHEVVLDFTYWSLVKWLSGFRAGPSIEVPLLFQSRFLFF